MYRDTIYYVISIVFSTYFSISPRVGWHRPRYSGYTIKVSHARVHPCKKEGKK